MRKVLHGIFAAAAILGCISTASAADSWKDENGDEFTYQIVSGEIKITAVKDNGDGKVVAPEKIDDKTVYSFDCQGKGLSELDLSQCIGLRALFCQNNKLTSLDTGKNTELTGLTCDYNRQLTELDLSKNTKLQSLSCEENRLTEIDVSNNTDLLVLNCAENQLTALNIGNNTSLDYLKCDNNQLHQ